MGESTPQVNPLADPRAGSISLADWLNLSSITPAVANQLNLLVPTQEIRAFQRKIATREMVAAINLGEQPVFEAVVPDNEAWRFHWMTYFHNDNISHVVRFTLTPRLRNPDSFMVTTRQTVNEDRDTPVYSSMPTSPDSNSLFNRRGGPLTEFFPGDHLFFIDETTRADAVAGLARLMFRYELIPTPAAMATDDVWFQNVV